MADTSKKSTQQRLDEISTSDLSSLFVSPTTVYSEKNWGPVGRSAINLGEYHRSPFYGGTQHIGDKRYPTVVDKLRFAQAVVPGLESLDQLISAKDRFGSSGKPGYFVAVKDEDDASKSRKLSSKQIRLLHHSEEKPFGELSRQRFATIQASLRKEGATVKRPWGYEDPTRAALTPPEILEDVPPSMQGHPVFFDGEKPSEELQEWIKQGVNFHRAPDGTMVISKRGADPEEWTIPHEKLHAALASDDPSINEFYRKELATLPSRNEEVFIEYAVLKDAPVEEQQKHRDSIYLNYRTPVIGDPDIWDNEELLDKALRKFLSIKTDNPHIFKAPKSTEEELKRLEKMARYNDRFHGRKLSKFREALYSSRYFLEHVKDSPLFPEEFREDIYTEYWDPKYVDSDTGKEEGIARHFAAGGLVENNLKKDSYGGLVDTGPKLTGEPTPYALANGLATLGRYGDNYMVHASDGETVVPGEILAANPRLKEDLFRQMRMMGVQDPNRYVVGNGLNSINPVTGQPEFFFKKLLSFALPIIGNMILPGMGGPIASAAATKLTGGSTKEALMAGLGAVGTQALLGGLGGMGKTGPGFMKGAQASLGQMFRSPSAAWQQGIFGGGNLGSIYGSTIGKGIPSVAGTASTQTPIFAEHPLSDANIGLSRAPINTRVIGGGADPRVWTGEYAPNPLDDLSGHASTRGTILDEGNWFSNLSNWGKAGVVGGGVLGLGALTGAFDTKKEAEEGQAGRSARERAYDELTELPHTLRFNEDGTPTDIAQTLMAQAGIGPSFTAGQLGPAAGITPEQAEEYLRQTYGIVAARGGAINGPGTGTSDDIPARLSDGEFVMTADAVMGAGNGNRQRGAAKMYDMMHQFERVA